MKTKLSKLFGVLAVIFSFTISSCQKDQVDPISSAAVPMPLVNRNFVEWAKNAKVVPDSTDKYLLSYDSIELRFADRGDKFMETVKAGEILASNLGYLRFVDRVEKEGDQLVLHTHKAEITDAIRNCYIEVETVLQPIAAPNSRTEARVFSSTIGLKAKIKSGGANANAKASMSVTYDLAPAVKCVIKIDKGNFAWSLPTLQIFDVSMSYVGTLTKRLKVEGAMGFSYSASLLSGYPLTPVPVMPGLLITPTLGITGEVSGEASGVWDWTIVKQQGSTIGASYNINTKGFTPYRTPYENGSRSITSDIEASATISITPKITLSLNKIDALGSVSVFLKSYLTASSKKIPATFIDNKPRFEFGLVAGVQGGIGVKLLTFSNNWDNLFDIKKIIY